MEIKPEALAQLKKDVKFRKPEDVHQFIADAIKIYIQLGKLTHQGNKLQILTPDGKTVALKLPFDASNKASKSN